MSADLMSTTAATGNSPLARVGRWIITKVWLGCVLSGAYAMGHHFGWPQALLTAAAVVGAVALAFAVHWLPTWTRSMWIGVPPVDIGIRVIVWAGLLLCVISLLISYPAAGAPAGTLLINSAFRTFRRDKSTA